MHDQHIEVSFLPPALPSLAFLFGQLGDLYVPKTFLPPDLSGERSLQRFPTAFSRINILLSLDLLSPPPLQRSPCPLLPPFFFE